MVEGNPRSFPFLFDQESLEIPRGWPKAVQSVEKSALDELAEETGFCSKKIKEIGKFSSNAGIDNGWCHVFLAEELEPVVAEKDETEDFEPVRLTPTELDTAIASGEIWDGFTIAGWTLAKNYLFDGSKS